jgi:hypothetical protein
MKRSDMLRKALEERGHEEVNSMYCIEDIYEEALDIFEYLGMSPPNDGKKRAIKKSSVPCVINAMNCLTWGEE